MEVCFYLAVGLLYPLTFNAALHCIKRFKQNKHYTLYCYGFGVQHSKVYVIPFVLVD